MEVEFEIAHLFCKRLFEPSTANPCDDGGVGQPCGVLSQLRDGVESI